MATFHPRLNSLCPPSPFLYFLNVFLGFFYTKNEQLILINIFYWIFISDFLWLIWILVLPGNHLKFEPFHAKLIDHIAWKLSYYLRRELTKVPLALSIQYLTWTQTYELTYLPTKWNDQIFSELAITRPTSNFKERYYNAVVKHFVPGFLIFVCTNRSFLDFIFHRRMDTENVQCPITEKWKIFNLFHTVTERFKT